MSILMLIYIVFRCQRSVVISIVNVNCILFFLRLRRYVLRLRHHRYGYDIIVTVTTSTLLLRLLEAYFKLLQLVP
jgi:hypothetical protein